MSTQRSCHAFNGTRRVGNCARDHHHATETWPGPVRRSLERSRMRFPAKRACQRINQFEHAPWLCTKLVTVVNFIQKKQASFQEMLFLVDCRDGERTIYFGIGLFWIFCFHPPFCPLSYNPPKLSSFSYTFSSPRVWLLFFRTLYLSIVCFFALLYLPKPPLCFCLFNQPSSTRTNTCTRA